MKKLLVLSLGLIFLTGCNKNDMLPEPVANVSPELKINSVSGIKLQSSFVTTEVAMNVKLVSAGTITIKITDISNKVVSKEVMNVKTGDNILKVYTSALPSSAYRIGLYDSNGNLIGITDFNKL